MDLRIFDLINRKVDERVEMVSNSLCDGVAKDYAEYRALCGIIQGLRSAQLEINDLLRKIKEDDDE
jgi:hypothetical protein